MVARKGRVPASVPGGRFLPGGLVAAGEGTGPGHPQARLRHPRPARYLGGLEGAQPTDVRWPLKTPSDVLSLIHDEGESWIAAGFRSLASLFAFGV